MADCSERCSNAKIPDDPFDPSNGYTEVPVLKAVWPKEWVCGGVGSHGSGGNGSSRAENGTAAGAITLSFGLDGAITKLESPAAVPWASPTARLGQLLYQGIDQDQMTDFIQDYSAGAQVNLWNFGKPGFNSMIPSVNATPKVTKFYTRTSGSSSAQHSSSRTAAAEAAPATTDFLLMLEYPLALQLSDNRGVPKQLMVLVQVQYAIHYTLYTQH
jgi:hypothetical protein